VRLLTAALFATAVVGAVAVPSAQAIIVPGDPNDPPPTYPPNSSGWCFVNTGGTLTASTASVAAGGSITVSWSVSLPGNCTGTVSIVGAGFSGQSLADSGSMVVTAPLLLGDTTWHLSATIPTQVPKALDTATSNVVTPQKPAVSVAQNADGRMELFRVQPSGGIVRRPQPAPAPCRTGSRSTAR
jgi:hypothetical protein